MLTVEIVVTRSLSGSISKIHPGAGISLCTELCLSPIGRALNIPDLGAIINLMLTWSLWGSVNRSIAEETSLLLYGMLK